MSQEIITMHGQKKDLVEELKKLMKNPKTIYFFAILATITLLFLGVPRTVHLAAQKIIPSVQKSPNKYVPQNNITINNNSATPDAIASAPATGKASPVQPVTPSRVSWDWRNLNHEQLLAYTPSVQDSGEYIKVLLQKTDDRYNEIKYLELTQEQKALVAKDVYKETKKKIAEIEKNINASIKSKSQAF